MYQVGIDIGSSMAKAVAMKDGKITKTVLLATGYSSRQTADEIYRIFEEEGISAENAVYTATGYGRISVPYADKVVTEITCHAKGADFLFHADGTVIDIGGQDTKGIALKAGRVMKFVMNDKCSAGTGKFLEVMAARLGLTHEELSSMAAAGAPVTISSMCTVFAESEVISLIGRGTAREDIARGVIDSVIKKVSQLISQVENSRYFLTGGLCEDAYIARCLSEALGASVDTVPLARYAGAIGAAIIANQANQGTVL